MDSGDFGAVEMNIEDMVAMIFCTGDSCRVTVANVMVRWWW